MTLKPLMHSPCLCVFIVDFFVYDSEANIQELANAQEEITPFNGIQPIKWMLLSLTGLKYPNITYSFVKLNQYYNHPNESTEGDSTAQHFLHRFKISDL